MLAALTESHLGIVDSFLAHECHSGCKVDANKRLVQMIMYQSQDLLPEEALSQGQPQRNNRMVIISEVASGKDPVKT